MARLRRAGLQLFSRFVFSWSVRPGLSLPSSPDEFSSCQVRFLRTDLLIWSTHGVPETVPGFHQGGVISWACWLGTGLLRIAGRNPVGEAVGIYCLNEPPLRRTYVKILTFTWSC